MKGNTSEFSNSPVISPKMTQRVTIICADLDGLPIHAFEYLVLHLNTLQKDIEYQFLPLEGSPPMLRALRPYAIINMDKFKRHAHEFVKNLKTSTLQTSEAFNLRDKTIGRVLIISLSKLNTNYYELFEDSYSALFLGEWKTTMAPPSLLEFLISLVMMEGMYALLPEAQEVSHLATRGCIGDFNMTLRDVRYKTLQGFICADCRRLLESAIGAERADIWTVLLKKEWFGKMSEPTSPASMVSKLGYDLFITKGLEPGRWEKIKKTLSEDGIKEMLKLIGGLILAALVLWLGLKKN